MRILVVGKGMFGAATARHLAARAEVVLIGPDEPEDSARHEGVFASHYDEGRIIGQLSFDPLWIDLVARAAEGMRSLDGQLVRRSGVLIALRSAEPDVLEAADALREWLDVDLRRIDLETQRRMFPALRLGRDETLLLETAGGYFSPRRYVALAEAHAVELGARVVRQHVVRLRSSRAYVEASLADGSCVAGDRAVVAAGAFIACFDLLPRRPLLRVKSESYLAAEVDAAYVDDLARLPCVVRELDDPELADLYFLPPIAYPDGRVYLKLGANTLADRWLEDLDALGRWYRSGDSDAQLPALRRALLDLLPEETIRSCRTGRCAEAYTAHGRPYVDVVEPGRVIAAVGGNGRSAQVADAVGMLAAELALDGEWSVGLPREAFAFVPAPAVWEGATLLRDRPRTRRRGEPQPTQVQ